MVEYLKYGNTNTYFFRTKAGLLLDTDMAGTLPAFFREIKRHSMSVKDISYVMATHYHPDHMGLIGELMRMGVKLVLFEHQQAYVHFSDELFSRQPRLHHCPIDEREALVLSCDHSRSFLAMLGIHGEVIPTYSHSPDGIALVLDDGACFVGDLEPMAFMNGYPSPSALQADWQRLMARHPRVIHYGHANDQQLDAISEKR